MSDPVTPPPPRHAERLLEALGADPYLREVVLGDLAEEHALRAHWSGAREARRWYYRESLRSVPFLLRGWWRRLRPSDVASIVATVAVAWVAASVVQRGIVFAFSFVPLTLMHPPTPLVAAVMFLWTTIDGVCAGYVAAWVGRRAPLPSALAWALTLLTMMALAQGHPAPAWFRIVNAIVMIVAVLGGGMLRVVHARGRPTPAPHGAGEAS